jgi:hypothetical protein
MNTIALSALLAGCFSLGSIGCSASAPVAPRSPTVAFAASASDVVQGCAPVGMPRVVAMHVVPKAGVTATAGEWRLGLRFATAGNPRATMTLDAETLDVVEGEPLPAPTASSSARGPVDVELPDHRHLVAWTEGSAEAGLRVQATTVGADGASGAPVDLGFQGSAVGQPAIAVTPAGNGVIAFIESNGLGFQLVVTRVACAAP